MNSFKTLFCTFCFLPLVFECTLNQPQSFLVAPEIKILSYQFNPAICTVSVAFSNTVITSNVSFDSVIVDSLPPGISCDKKTGEISGIPTSPALSKTLVTAYSPTGIDSEIVTIVIIKNSTESGKLKYQINPAIAVLQEKFSDSLLFSQGTIDSVTLASGTLPSGLKLTKAGPAAGLISGVPLAPADWQGYTIYVWLDGNITDSLLLTLLVNSQKNGALTYTNNPAICTVSVSFSNPVITNDITFDSVIAESLPQGFSCDKKTGEISGTPTTPALSKILVIAYTSAGIDSEIVTFLAILPSTESEKLHYKSNPAIAVVQEKFSDSLLNFQDSIDSVTLANNPFPSGLKLTKTGPAAGLISGTPLSPSDWQGYTIYIWLDGNITDSLLLALIVNPQKPGPLSYTYNPATCTVSIAFSNPMTNSGGVADSIIAISLPTGLSCNKTTGLISGTPTTNSNKKAYKILAYNASGVDSVFDTITVVAKQVTLVKPGPLSYQYNPAICSVSVEFSNTLTNRGGTIDSVIAISLPTGLSCNKITGLISGTPTEKSTKKAYKILAYNTSGIDSVFDTITVVPRKPGPLVYNSSPAVCTTSVFYSFPVINSGGTVDSFVAPQLPAGLSINKTTGTISGNPSSATNKTGYKVKAYNISGVDSCFDTITVIPSNLNGPVISSVTGTFSTNQTVQISGRDFSNKAPAAPLVWADFSSNINPTHLGSRTSWDDNTNLVRTTNLPSGAGTDNGVVGTWNSITAPTRSFSFGVYMPRPYYQKVYTFGKRRFDFPTTSNQKTWRINPYRGYSPPHAEDPILAYGNGSYLAHLNECDSGNRDRFTNIQYTANTWMTEEVIWSFTGGSGLYYDGSPADGDGVFQYERNGELIFRQESINNCENVYGDLRMFDNFTPNNTVTDTPATGSHVYMTYLYADTVYNRVLIGDQPTLAASTHREIQIPQTWSDNGTTAEISIVFNQGAFTSGSTAYIFVVDAYDKPSNGRQIIIGSTQ